MPGRHTDVRASSYPAGMEVYQIIPFQYVVNRLNPEQVQEECLFQINYRADIDTTHGIRYKGILYDITRVDVFEGYKGDLTLYCKRQGIKG